VIWARVVEERARQDARFGRPAVRLESPAEWLVILVEEVGEVAVEVQGEDTGALVGELVQVAAVAIAFAESLVGGE